MATIASRDAGALVAEAERARSAQDMAAACAAINAAAQAAPDHPGIAFMQAQFAYEGWHPAAAMFERAALLNPGNADVVRNFALALASEGDTARAERLLEGVLARVPGWQEGHNTLATLRVTTGDSDPWRSFAEATMRTPDDPALYRAWFQRLAAVKDWTGAQAVLAKADRRGVTTGLAMLQLYLACESGAAPADPAIFAPFAASQDPGLALLQVRHALRHGDWHRALGLAEAQLGTPHAAQFWPYCSLAWRLLDDPRAAWLEGDPGFAEAIDLDLGSSLLEELSQFVRGLHRMTAPYPEQSVRGGVQTDRNLLLHHATIIADLRNRLAAAVAGWRDSLPENDPAHPLLSRKPAAIRFAGSWSVRLTGGGYHSAHTHPRGWASTALYLAIPGDPGQAHAGQLAIGMPPPELGLGLVPLRHIAPRPGRLAIFPSTTWHGTVPFAGEERLTIAFDIAPQTYGTMTQNG
jgi:Tfp pilus assembly protein PilF